MTEPEPVRSIARGLYAEYFSEVEAKTCGYCGAGGGQQCWDWPEDPYHPLVRIERVVPHRERIEAWQNR